MLNLVLGMMGVPGRRCSVSSTTVLPKALGYCSVTMMGMERAVAALIMRRDASMTAG